MRRFLFGLFIASMLLSVRASAQFAQRLDAPGPDVCAGLIPAAQAKDYLGREVTICGRVTRTAQAKWLQGSPTYLIVGDPAVWQFRVVILEKDLRNFSSSPNDYRSEPQFRYFHKVIEVRGIVRASDVNGVPEIVVIDPGQITILKTGW
jgi:hypothetical protein